MIILPKSKWYAPIIGQLIKSCNICIFLRDSHLCLSIRAECIGAQSLAAYWAEHILLCSKTSILLSWPKYNVGRLRNTLKEKNRIILYYPRCIYTDSIYDLLSSIEGPHGFEHWTMAWRRKEREYKTPIKRYDPIETPKKLTQSKDDTWWRRYSKYYEKNYNIVVPSWSVHRTIRALGFVTWITVMGLNASPINKDRTLEQI